MSYSNFIPLESIQIASPCHADWNSMRGDERARFCQSCHKNVYNLATMTRLEAEQLIKEKEGRLCLRMYRRADGTVITSDCPIGMATKHLEPRYARNGHIGKLATFVVVGITALLAILGISWPKASVLTAGSVTMGTPPPLLRASTLISPTTPSSNSNSPQP